MTILLLLLLFFKKVPSGSLLPPLVTQFHSAFLGNPTAQYHRTPSCLSQGIYILNKIEVQGET
jgi:hypothetical protein